MNDVELARGRALKIGKYLIFTAWASIFAHVFCGAMNLIQQNLAMSALTGRYTSRADLIQMADRTGYLYLTGGTVSWILDGACIILMLYWVYCSDALARALGSDRMSHGPNWSVGWFFVPFANLVKPFFVLKEIYMATAMPKRYDLNLPANGLLTAWWLVMIADRAFDLARSELMESPKNLEAKLTMMKVFMALEVSAVLAAGLLIMVVMAFMREQEASMPYEAPEGLAFAR